MKKPISQPKKLKNHTLILASTSPFRRALLEKLDLAFAATSPVIDETAIPGETPRELVVRLSEAKARAGLEQHPDALIIGSDQVACIDGQILGKPGSREKAILQLRQASGRKVAFYTGLCLIDGRSGKAQIDCVPFFVHFRELTHVQIESYVEREQPLNCAGSFKSEGLGIALFSKLEGDDPNTLVGLPLIRLTQMLEAFGVDVL